MKQSVASNEFTRIFSAFKRLGTIPAEPELTAETWCEVQPCLRIPIRSRGIIVTQPTSSLWVYLLGLFTIGVGAHFLRFQGGEPSRLWWGIALLLWGVGALLAGTSYQAFGYHIKCAGWDRCAWTSWWEVVYLILHQLSLDALLAAAANSLPPGSWRSALLTAAVVIGALYTIITLAGGLIPVRSLITFERMVWISSPVLAALLSINLWRFSRYQDPGDLVVGGGWLLLVVITAAYWIYDRQGMTEKLWSRGTWFSQNDVLHIGLIVWMLYIAFAVTRHIPANVPF